MTTSEYPCPHCQQSVYLGTQECPNCGEDPRDLEGSLNKRLLGVSPSIAGSDTSAGRAYAVVVTLWLISVAINGLVVFWFLMMALAGTVHSSQDPDVIFIGTIVFSLLPLLVSLALIGEKKHLWAAPLIPFLAMPLIFIGFLALGY